MKGRSMIKFFMYLFFSILLLTPIKVYVNYLLDYYGKSGPFDIGKNLLFTFLSLFLVGGITTFIKMLFEWFIYQQDKNRLELENIQSELQFLKSQINPHFLFNTLNNLYALALLKSEQTPELILKLSQLMRYMLYECNEPKVSLKNEINYLNNYLDLEKLRQKDHTNITFTIKGEVVDQEIAPLILMTFVENAFKHGANKVLQDPFVKIVLEVDNQKLIFTVENSIPDIVHENTSIKRAGGIGLTNVKKRLDLLYNDKYNLSISNMSDIYKIELFLTLN